MDVDLLKSELTFKAVRSSGSGGQHVNKVASKVVLYFNLEKSTVFSEEEKNRLRAFLKNRLNKQGVLILYADESRSQFRNKTIVTQRFLELVEESLKPEKERKPTKISKAEKRKRLDNKRKHSEKKTSRKKPNID
ncbi:alternative ribosome rescue aminoacyl-tRNA hydrolase ArfB [uncultured Winogradskyella sp.]|uniref:alternative ribosome rescue aminoacyl-tRNA hydrolase ArfB n=1 Tax=uncultured Winogradskyella sp. TaxID=395353 RepID=UPI0026136254|nr:alternative ribosome rescue aminoacyl-tRNA hydrolase ArfB [uncultured Winogradskyella sp.]